MTLPILIIACVIGALCLSIAGRLIRWSDRRDDPFRDFAESDEGVLRAFHDEGITP